jgi:hypothetical protein
MPAWGGLYSLLISTAIHHAEASTRTGVWMHMRAWICHCIHCCIHGVCTLLFTSLCMLHSCCPCMHVHYLFTSINTWCGAQQWHRCVRVWLWMWQLINNSECISIDVEGTRTTGGFFKSIMMWCDVSNSNSLAKPNLGSPWNLYWA